jgi:hypothetical protein
MSARPVLLLGAQRSGTTALATVLLGSRLEFLQPIRD